MTLSVDGHVPGAHVHPAQEERFEIVSGTMKFRMNGKKIVAGPGETVVVPAGARHKFANGGDEEVQVRVTVTPAMKMEDLLENTIALAEEGKTNRKGMPKPVHLALFVREYEREVRAPFPPAGRRQGADGAAGRLRPRPRPRRALRSRRARAQARPRHRLGVTHAAPSPASSLVHDEVGRRAQAQHLPRRHQVQVLLVEELEAGDEARAPAA